MKSMRIAALSVAAIISLGGIATSAHADTIYWTEFLNTRMCRYDTNTQMTECWWMTPTKDGSKPTVRDMSRKSEVLPDPFGTPEAKKAVPKAVQDAYYSQKAKR